MSHRTLCKGKRLLAGHCPSTALSLSMHQHLVAAQTWNHLHGKPGRKVLEMVAANQVILVSTGANDWLESNGRVDKVEGGYRVHARKSFASGSPIGTLHAGQFHPLPEKRQQLFTESVSMGLEPVATPVTATTYATAAKV